MNQLKILSQLLLTSQMNYLKDLFVNGKYHIYIGFALLIQGQRKYLLPHSNIYKQIKRDAIQQLLITKPDQDNTNLVLQDMSAEDLNYLKALTKKKIEQIQHITRDQQSTLPISFLVLALGSINYFLNPPITAIFVGGYCSLLAVDYAKSITVIRMGVQPLWRWKMRDMGYVIACCFGVVTFAVAARAGIARIKEQATKAVTLRKGENLPGKK